MYKYYVSHKMRNDTVLLRVKLRRTFSAKIYLEAAPFEARLERRMVEMVGVEPTSRKETQNFYFHSFICLSFQIGNKAKT